MYFKRVQCLPAVLFLPADVSRLVAGWGQWRIWPPVKPVAGAFIKVVNGCGYWIASPEQNDWSSNDKSACDDEGGREVDKQEEAERAGCFHLRVGGVVCGEFDTCRWIQCAFTSIISFIFHLPILLVPDDTPRHSHRKQPSILVLVSRDRRHVLTL